MPAKQSLIYLLVHVKKLILFLLFTIVFTRVAHAAMPPPFRTGRITLSADSEYFWTKSNYDENGASQNLLSDNSYSNLTNTFGAAYFISGGWALTGGARFAYASSKSLEDRTNGEITNFFMCTKKLISFSKLRFIPEAELTISTQKIAPETDSVLTNEGVHSVRVGSGVTYDFWKIRTYGYVGLDYRDDGRSSLLPWAGGLGLKNSQWFFSAELNGYQSITDDDYTDSPLQRAAVTSKVSGGSLRYYSVNPNLIEARIQAGFDFANNYNLNFGYAHTLAGENTAIGQTVLVGFAYNIHTTVSDTQKTTRRQRIESDSRLGKGTMDTDEAEEQKLRQKNFEPLIEEDYDETLFEDD